MRDTVSAALVIIGLAWPLAFLNAVHAANQTGASHTKITHSEKPSAYADPARCKLLYGSRIEDAERLIRCLYEPYRADETLNGPASGLAVLATLASKRLKYGLLRETQCTQRRHELCALEADGLIWAQDVSKFQMRDIAFDHAQRIATIRFENANERFTVNIIFAQQTQRLEIEDVRLVDRDGSSASESLMEILERYDYGR